MLASTSTSTATDRLGTNLALAVDQALALAERQGVRAAAAYLVARGAGFALTCRVLAEPAWRRQADYSADDGSSSPYSHMR